ncbi:MAG: hypothetical protein JRK26_06450 [Deltaproteobacteria bacterium]|nr:hypothetical protein [Deltaproteobacteria bacterium]
MRKDTRAGKIVLILAGIFLCTANAVPAESIRDNGIWRLGLDNRTGAITALQARRNLNREWIDLLPGGGQGPAAGVTVYDVATGRTFRPGDPEVGLVGINWEDSSAEVSQSINLDGELVSIVLRYSFSGIELLWEAVLTGSSQGNRSLRVAFELPLVSGSRLWFQNLPEMVRAGDGMQPGSAWYVRAPEGFDRFDNQYPRHDLTLPLVVVIDPQEKLGVTLSHPVDQRQPSAGFVRAFLPDSTPCLRSVTALTGLRGSRPLTVSGCLVAHSPCYRPALEWMLGKWPEYFKPHPGIYDKDGIYSIGNPGTGARDSDGKYNYQGLLEYKAFFFEMHAHFPWYGLYFPDNPQTDSWPDLAKIERGKPREDRLSVAVINQRLENLDEAGFHVFYYFAINDGYPPEARRRWPDAIARWPDRVALSGWRGGGIEYRNMNADTSFSFGKDLLRQFDGISSQVRPLAGIFFDTVHHNDLDFAHDDGLTLVCLDSTSVPAYSINFCYDYFLDYISQKLHSQGQYLFINGPGAIRNARGVDAIMLEGEGAPEWEYEFEYRRFLSCMVRPMIWLFPNRPHKRREILLQRCLLYGAIPSAPPSAREPQADRPRSEEDGKLWRPYLPLYETLRGRRLCFEPDPLDVPTGFRGEIFTLPDGGYAVVLINESMSVLDPANSAGPTVTLRLAKRISDVRVITPLDHKGRKIKPLYTENGRLQLTVPDFRGAAVIFLKPKS